MSSLPIGLESLAAEVAKDHCKKQDFEIHMPSVRARLNADALSFLSFLRQKHGLRKDFAFQAIAIRTEPELEERNRDQKGRPLQVLRFYGRGILIDVLWNRSGNWSSELEWADQMRANAAES